MVVLGRIPDVDRSDYNQYLRQTYSPLYQALHWQSRIDKTQLHRSLKPNSAANAKIQALTSEFKHVTFLDPEKIHPQFWQTAPLSPDNILIYKDSAHLNQYGSDLWGQQSAPQSQDIFRKL